MTNGNAGSKPSREIDTRANKRAIARTKAQDLRDEHKKKDRRNKLLLQGGIILASLLVVGTIAFTIVAQIPVPRTGPVNMLSDGIKVGEGFVAETTAGLSQGAEPVPSVTEEGSEVIDIRVYLDYQCPACKDFEETNYAQLATWVETGAATLEVHPIATLDHSSLGMKYSTRAANASACVANYSPNAFFDFNSLMFAHQPEEGTEGLTDPELFALAQRADVSSSTLIEECIIEQNYKSWVNSATARAVAGPVPNSTIERVTQTPTVIVNGEQYTGSISDADAFARFVSTSAGNAFTEKSATATPTPTPTP